MSSLERTYDLLADRAVQPLDDTELRELDALLRQQPELDDDSFDLAAAAFDLALGPTEYEPMPASLRDRLRVQGEELLAGPVRETSPVMSPAPASAAPSPSAPQRGPTALPAEPRGSVLPWFLAIAASLLALMGWMRSDTEVTTIEVADARDLLVGDATDLLRQDWKAAGDPLGTGVSGNVIWSDAKQEGYMTFKGLAANDPTVEQYQLWIFDKNQSTDTPVDGGVFDIQASDTGETVVAIDPKIQIGEGFAFAITVEKPGGVVVSSRERLALVAGL